tara:strand:+ start:1631 stop:2269 length:639 start_codon:yes stop_codon:yes gene_type:complete
MKTILCFGDSNTWGYSPKDGSRFPPNIRWTGTLQSLLGADYNIIEEGLNGRTTFINEKGRGARAFRSGSDLFPTILESHRPLNLVIIMLGSNDLKLEYNLSVEEIAKGAKALCKQVIDSEYLVENPPLILLISPTHFNSEIIEHGIEIFGDPSEKSRQFAKHYQKVAEELGIYFLDAAKYVVPSEGEGIHWDADQHIKFGKVLAQKIAKILL